MNPSTPSQSGFCFLKDQKPISREAYLHACHLRDQIGALIACREDHLKRMGRAAEIHLPHGNWELGNTLYSCHKTLAAGDYSVINNLRLFSQIFTGYQLVSLSSSQGLPIPREIPADLDERLAARADFPDPEVADYLETVAHLPPDLHISPANVFGEIGWTINGKIINYDTNVYLERIVLLAECGKLWELRNRTPENAAQRNQRWERLRILEIGSGYGGLAHHLQTLIPEGRYFLVDIPESLLFSSIYLSTLWPDKDNVLITPDNLHELRKETSGFTFVPNFLFDDCCATGMEFDLVINTLSMSEMTEEQVSYYSKGIARLINRRGVFFEQNHDNRLLGFIDAKATIAEHFRYCLPVRSPILPSKQGSAHLWADAPVKPYAWEPASRELAPGIADACTETATCPIQRPNGTVRPGIAEFVRQFFNPFRSKARPAAAAPKEEPHRIVEPVALVVEGVGGFNILQVGDRYLAFHQSRSAFDVEKYKRGQYGRCLTGATPEEVRQKIVNRASL